MIHAYDRSYLSSASVALGRACDYASHDAGILLDDFWGAFLASSACAAFEGGDAGVLVGASGIDLARSVLRETGVMSRLPAGRPALDRSREYWAGWALAHYQWETSLPFAEIAQAVPIARVVEMFNPYHEMDVRHFIVRMHELYRAAFPESRIKRRRAGVGLSQRELADLSGIPLRTVQQYEQRQKSLARAGAETVIRLAMALSCRPIDLLDLVPPEPGGPEGRRAA